MKKILLSGLLFILFVTASCSSDDSPSASGGLKVASFREKIYVNGNLNSDYNFVFNYQDGKLVNVVRGTSTIEFTYSGDKITTSNVYVNDVLSSTTDYNYSGNLLTSIIYNVQDEKTDLIYSGNVLQSMKSSYLDGGTWIQHQQNDYTFSNNNIQQKVRTNSDGSFAFSYKSSYDYDNANNPFRNMNPYLRLIVNFETIDIISKNNVTKQYSYPSVGSTTPTLSHNYVIDYNADNYPVSVKKYLVAANELIAETVITYTE
jgi:hypothetical protein